MYGLFLIVGMLLAALGAAVFCVLLKAPEEHGNEALCPFAVLPVTDAAPSTRAFLERYASQIAWMDESVLRCVLLVYLPEETNAQALCSDMAREYDFFTAVSLPEAQALLAKRVQISQKTD